MSPVFDLVAPYVIGDLRLSPPAGAGSLRFESPDDNLALRLAPFFAGPQGPSGDAPSVVAAEAIGGGRAVTVSGLHCTPATVAAFAGISFSAAVAGSPVVYVARGPYTELSWAWVPGLPLYVGPAGVLTQIPPSSGRLRIVAWAVSATVINVDPSDIVELATGA